MLLTRSTLTKRFRDFDYTYGIDNAAILSDVTLCLQ